jgi:hypothetical protein
MFSLQRGGNSTLFFEEANNVGGATNWNLIDKFGNQVLFRTSSYANFAQRWFLRWQWKVRGVLTKFGSDYQLLAVPKKDVVMTAPSSVPFFSQISKPWLIKPI